MLTRKTTGKPPVVPISPQLSVSDWKVFSRNIICNESTYSRDFFLLLFSIIIFYFRENFLIIYLLLSHIHTSHIPYRCSHSVSPHTISHWYTSAPILSISHLLKYYLIIYLLLYNLLLYDMLRSFLKQFIYKALNCIRFCCNCFVWIHELFFLYSLIACESNTSA
jgi:hypothetical protein